MQSLLGNGGYAFFSLMLFLFLVRKVDQVMYGQWVIFMTVASLADLFRTGLAGTGAIRKISISRGAERELQAASSYYLSIFTTAGISFLFLIAGLVIRGFADDSFYASVFLMYPILGISNLPLIQSLQYSQGLLDFRRVMVIRIVSGFLNLVIPGLYVLFSTVTFEGLVLVYASASFAGSVVVSIAGWDGRKTLKHFDMQSVKSLYSFGKYGMLSTISSSFLRSSDTIIISLAPIMGAGAVAIYAIPFKLVELVEIPLRSFTSTVYPKLSRAIKEDLEQFNQILYEYITYTILLLFPVLVMMGLFPEILLGFLGGKAYAGSLDIQAQILYILVIYIFLLPLDRYMGMALFALDKPKVNFKKISLMLLSNIIFDLIAVFIFKSLAGVAMASVFFTLVGILVGIKYISRESGFRISKLFSRFEVTVNYLIFIVKNMVYVRKSQAN